MNRQGHQMSAIRQQHYLQKFFLIAVGLCVFLVSTWLTAAVHQPVAFAHAFVIGSDPVDGSTVSSAPSVVRIYFDAPISSASAAYVYNPQEQVVNATHSSIPSNHPRELDIPLKNPGQLPVGSYTVHWTALATDDGHTTHGVIGFNIGQSSTGLSGVTILGPSTSNILPTLDLIGILAVAWEWLITVALTFWIGILVIEGIVYNGKEQSSALLIHSRKQTQPLQWFCLLALLIGEIIVLILRAAQFTQSLTGNTLDPVVLGQILFQSTYGSLWIARVIFILGSLGLLWWTTNQQNQPNSTRNRKRSGFSRHRDYLTQEQFLVKKGAQVAESQSTTSLALSSSLRAFTIAWLILAGLILITYALSGDAAQRDAQLPIYAIVLGWLSLAAQYTWFGGLAYLGYVLLPLLSIIEPDRRIRNTHIPFAALPCLDTWCNLCTSRQ